MEKMQVVYPDQGFPKFLGPLVSSKLLKNYGKIMAVKGTESSIENREEKQYTATHRWRLFDVLLWQYTGRPHSCVLSGGSVRVCVCMYVSMCLYVGLQLLDLS